MKPTLPAGQRARADFPRFGVPALANRLRAVPDGWQLRVEGQPVDLHGLPRKEVLADFHCVTTWSHCHLRWEGYSFQDFYERVLLPRSTPQPFVEIKALDGPRVCCSLADLLHPDTLLADTLHGQPLCFRHGAPLRLVAPHLYGYKNVKHVAAIRLVGQFQASLAERQTLAHPRGRVALEERGRWLPGWFYRYLYRALMPATMAYYRHVESRGATVV